MSIRRQWQVCFVWAYEMCRAMFSGGGKAGMKDEQNGIFNGSDGADSE